jgi:transitional endoplasmic reticulum ATPase
VRPTITEDIRDYYQGIEEEFRGGGPEPQGRSSGRIGFQ